MTGYKGGNHCMAAICNIIGDVLPTNTHLKSFGHALVLAIGC